MKLLRLPSMSFSRPPAWRSRADQDLWAPRFDRLHKEWRRVEIESVLAGIRPCAQQPLGMAEYLAFLPWAHSNGLHVKLLRTAGGFTGFAQSYEEGTDLMVTAVARRAEDLETETERNGYPECCITAFNRMYPTVVDPMWQWAEGGTETYSDAVLRQPGPGGMWTDHKSVTHTRTYGSVTPLTNPLLRYVDARLTPHIPCSARCTPSMELAEKFRQLLHPEALAWIEELLESHIRWDCHRGVALVKHPRFSLEFGSVPTAERYVVEVNR